jgi:hypothetical protein
LGTPCEFVPTGIAPGGYVMAVFLIFKHADRPYDAFAAEELSI